MSSYYITHDDIRIFLRFLKNCGIYERMMQYYQNRFICPNYDENDRNRMYYTIYQFLSHVRKSHFKEILTSTFYMFYWDRQVEGSAYWMICADLWFLYINKYLQGVRAYHINKTTILRLHEEIKQYIELNRNNKNFLQLKQLYEEEFC